VFLCGTWPPTAMSGRGPPLAVGGTSEAKVEQRNTDPSQNSYLLNIDNITKMLIRKTIMFPVVIINQLGKH
jgi:hypothetical protein